MLEYDNPNYGRLPILDGPNYAYWMMCMRTYMKFLDIGIWEAYQTPMKAADAHVTISKPKSMLSLEEKTVAFNDEKSLNDIFSWIGRHKVRLVQNFASTKEAWDILQSHCEGDASVN